MGFFSKTLDMLRWSETSGLPDTFGLTGSTLSSPFGGPYVLAPAIAHDLGLPYGASATALAAYKVPSVNKGLALLSSMAAGCQFVPVNPEDTVPEWLNRTDGNITAGMRLAALVSDLILHREAVWLTLRDTQDGPITQAIHLPRDVWELTPEGDVAIRGMVAPRGSVLYFQSFRPLGLLTAAADTIEHYHDLANTVRIRAKNPVHLLDLHLTEDWEGDEDDLKAVQENWSEARNAEYGAVAVTPQGVQAQAINGAALDGGMLTEARNAVRLDTANHLNLPAALLEGNSGTSGTYENTLQTKDELVSLSLAEWAAPIEQRLGQADALGIPVRLDVSRLTGPIDAARGNTGTAVATPTEKETTA